jgi:hypothetical protein
MARICKLLKRVARPERFELPTLWFEDKSTNRHKILRLNSWCDNKALSSVAAK